MPISPLLMLDIPSPSAAILPNLKQLPKDKIVLEYLLKHLSENSSPEKFDLISSIFDMYRTSAGFDPMAISKGRFKRVKAADFKRMIAEIDLELGSIIKTDEYAQLQAKQVNHSALFDRYLSLSDEVNMHPPSSMQHDVEQFEETIHHQESQELLLSFYRHHHKFFEVTYATSHLESLLEKYDLIQEKTKLHARQIRCGFILTWLEQEFVKGKADHDRIQQVWDELGILLTSETNKFTRHEILIRIIRCGLLTNTPSRNLEQYLLYSADNLEQIIHYNPDCSILLYTSLAHHHPNASIDKRNEWLHQAELLSREQGIDDIRGYFRLIRALNAADHFHTDEIIRHLNEAEHQVHRTQGRSFVAKNTWIQICEFRIMMFTFLHMKNPNDYPASEFDIHIRIAEDLGKHRYDNSVLALELRGYKNFVSKDWQSALECFERACSYRELEPENDHFYLDKYFVSLLKVKAKKKDESIKEALVKLKALGSPFFKSQAIALCNDAAVFFKEHQAQTSQLIE